MTLLIFVVGKSSNSAAAAETVNCGEAFFAGLFAPAATASSTSALTILSLGPVPFTLLRSNPCCSAKLFANGEMKTLPPSALFFVSC